MDEVLQPTGVESGLSPYRRLARGGRAGRRRAARRAARAGRERRMGESLPPPGVESDLSPYRRFARDDWARLRADTPLTLTADEVPQLPSVNDPLPRRRGHPPPPGPPPAPPAPACAPTRR